MFVYACEVFRWNSKWSFMRKKCYDEYACQIHQESTVQKWIDFYHSSQFESEFDIRDDELSGETDENKLHRIVMIKKKGVKSPYSVIVITVSRYEII